MFTVKVPVFDLWGDHTAELREEVIRDYKMDIPSHLVLHIPQEQIDRLRKIAATAHELRAHSIRFYIDCKVEAYRDDVLIEPTTYEEHSIRDTLRPDSISMTYDTFYLGFQCHPHYNTGWCEFCFETDHFRLPKLDV